MSQKIDSLRVFTVGRNYLYYLKEGREMCAAGQNGWESFVAQAEVSKSHLLEMRGILLKEAERLSIRSAQEIDREAGSEADRLLALIDEIDGYLTEKEEEDQDPPAVLQGRKSRKSYDGNLVKDLCNRFNMNVIHVLNTLNLSPALEEGWSNEVIKEWFSEYRLSRNAGADKRSSVAMALILAL